MTKKLRPSWHYTAESRKRHQAESDTIAQSALAFINGDVRLAIERAEDRSVLVEVPQAAYDNLPEFFRHCIERLADLGFKGTESHDGGGMYACLYVFW